MHVNKHAPASFNSPSNSQFEELVKESNGRCKFLFVYLFLFLKLPSSLKLGLLGTCNMRELVECLVIIFVYKR